MALSDLPFPLRVTALDRSLVFSELRTFDARLSEPEFTAMRLSVRSLVAREDRFTAFPAFSAVPYLTLSFFFPTLSDPFRATLVFTFFNKLFHEFHITQIGPKAKIKKVAKERYGSN